LPGTETEGGRAKRRSNEEKKRRGGIGLVPRGLEILPAGGELSTLGKKTGGATRGREKR